MISDKVFKFEILLYPCCFYKVTECMDGIRELNELEGQLETEKQESEDED